MFRVSAPTPVQHKHKVDALLMGKGARNASFVAMPAAQGRSLMHMGSQLSAAGDAGSEGGSVVLGNGAAAPKASTWEVMGQQTANPLMGPVRLIYLFRVLCRPPTLMGPVRLVEGLFV